jgi:isopenicillin N synthase-like dioxygenase
VEGLPIIDISPPRRASEPAALATEIDTACRDTGFFYVVGHGVSTALQTRVESLAREFFALPDAEKARVAMAHGGRAWRGWFPVGGELTSGAPDMKEGFYFGEEIAPDDPRVVDRTPLHGPNLFPDRPAGLRDAVLEYIDALTDVGHALLAAISRALGLDERWFDRNLTADPIVLFRIFHYPPLAPVAGERKAGERKAGERKAGERKAGERKAGERKAGEGNAGAWSVGEHTDYGLITMLWQDSVGGLEVRGRDGWVAAPPVRDAFVVNLGDMLERMTGGVYRSTPHRVRNAAGVDRISFPLFLDPAWDAEVLPIPMTHVHRVDDANDRWDGASVHEWSGTYGDYLLRKVSKVFPALLDEVLPTDSA